MADNTIKIGGELESMATGKIVAAASAIKDKSRNKTQEAINGDVEQAFSEQSEQFQRLSEETAESVSSAENAARQSKQYLADLKEAITDLPDGQAVSAQVAINQVDIAGLKSDIVVDLSTRYATSYANLSAALTALNSDTATDATAIKKGGVSIKFINSGTGKYEQWNLKASSWSTNTSDWALDVDSYSIPVDKIEKENTQSEEQAIIYETDGGTQVGKIDSTGANFINLKLGGQQVARMSDLPTKDSSIGKNPSTTNVPTTKAVKDYVDAHSGGDYPIETGTTASEEEEFIASNDAGTDTYVKVSYYGVKAKAYKKLNGDDAIPPLDTTIGDNPSNAHTPSTQAVKNYVDNNAGIGNLPISGETIASSDEEIIIANDNLSQEYAKVGSYGVKAKKYLDMNGNDILDGVGKTIRLLFIGSSFGVDTVSELGNIVQSVGKKIIIGNAYIGAATLDTFISRYRNHQGGIQYRKWFEGATSWSLWDGDNEEWLPNVGTGVSDEDIQAAIANTYLDFIIQDDAWDYIILQNGAYQSPYPDQSPFWIKDGQGNITRNIINEMIAICKKNCLYTNPVFGMNMTWAFSVYHTVSSAHLNDDYWVSYGENQGARQLGMYNNLATNYSDCLVNCEDIKFIIPSGTTIQLARQNQTIRESTNYTEVSGGMPTIAQAEAITSLTDIEQTYPFMDGDKNWKNKSDFTRDSIHADMVLTRFLIGATLYQKLLSKLYGIDISQSTYRQEQGSGDTRPQIATPVTDENFPTLVNIVKASIANPFTVNNNQ